LKTLVIGSGGREDALAWKLSKSPHVDEVFIAPGNAGTAERGTNVDIPATDIEGLRDFALERSIDLTIVGPELPLTLGIVDAFCKAGLRIFGPTKKAAAIEGSKSFCKDVMRRAGVPTADYRVFDSAQRASEYLETAPMPLVVKADGLAAGKGVIICRDKGEAVEALDLIMGRKAFGGAGERVVIEEFLEGEEASYLAITDGERALGLAPAQDHKAVFDGDRGPNTGGMGAYSPAPVITPALEEKILSEVINPLIATMADLGTPYRGLLYAGLMITENGEPRVLEFNCRFGDPEAQPILMRLEDDLFEVLYECAGEGIGRSGLTWDTRPSVCVVMASGGYPGAYDKGLPISGLDEAGSMEDVVVFHAGTRRDDHGRVVTSGGRVLGVTAMGRDIREARERAYEAVEKISFEKAYYRRDIAMKAIR